MPSITPSGLVKVLKFEAAALASIRAGVRGSFAEALFLVEELYFVGIDEDELRASPPRCNHV